MVSPASIKSGGEMGIPSIDVEMADVRGGQKPSSASAHEQPDLRSLAWPAALSEEKRSPTQVIGYHVQRAQSFLAMPWYKQLVLAALAGAYITFGASLSIFFSTGITEFGPRQFMLGLGFAFGFSMVVLSGAALFTEINVVLPEYIMARKRNIKDFRVIRFWWIVIAGNVLGAAIVGLLLHGGGIFPSSSPVSTTLETIITSKVAFKDDGASGWFRALVSGILANWLVGMASFLGASSREVPGKAIAMFIPVISFATLGAQHSPANVSYFAIAFARGTPSPSFWDALWYNVIPSGIGNFIGGSLFVAIAFWTTYGPKSKE